MPITRPRVVELAPGSKMHVIGLPIAFFSDLYYVFLRRSWPFFYCLMVGAYLSINVVFAWAYVLGGDCVANVKPGSFWDAFFFSVDTLGTIGYGYMYPKTYFAHALVMFESMVGIFSLATVTGLTFAKFSRPRARVLFSKTAVIGRHEGVPTLMFRMANARANHIAEATLHVVLLRRERTKEGRLFSRLIDLPLTRERSPMFTLTWTALHPIDGQSPLRDDTEETLRSGRCQIVCSLVGFDMTTGQTIHARYTYASDAIKWNARLKDILAQPTQKIDMPQIDYNHFHATEPDSPISD